jgi:AGCS family alanine or glycine:cation symporter
VEIVTDVFNWLNGIVWGPAMLVLILGTGLILMMGLRGMPLRRLGYGFRMLWKGRRSTEEGDISPFNALMTSLSATIGTGNIAGVGTAIALGGPGAVFWMWCTALVGMATKYAEAVLAVKYREVDEEGNHVGGPMYYIKNGLGGNWKWLGAAFAVFGAIAGFGIGNMVQANSVADALRSNLSVPVWVTGLVMAVLVFLVLIGGIRRIAQVAGRLVPFMAVAYLLGALAVILLNASQVPSALGLIFEHAFTPIAATGGFAGAAVMAAIQFGVARGVFSNEAGLGSAPIAHAAAKTDNPVRQGTVAMLGTFIDTIVICTMTALVIMISAEWTSINPAFQACVDQGGQVTDGFCALGDREIRQAMTGASLSAAAFGVGLPGLGNWIVTLGLVLFAFTTMLGWSVYGERCVEYLFGVRAILPFRLLWVLFIPLGATVKLAFVWLVADTLNALMAIPNLVALLALSPVVFKLTRDYFRDREAAAEIS